MEVCLARPSCQQRLSQRPLLGACESRFVISSCLFRMFSIGSGSSPRRLLPLALSLLFAPALLACRVPGGGTARRVRRRVALLGRLSRWLGAVVVRSRRSVISGRGRRRPPLSYHRLPAVEELRC